MMFLDFIGRFPASAKRRNRDQDWHVKCPAHDDGEAPSQFSLHVTGEADRILLRCFAGCQAEAIVTALKLTMADLYFSSPWPPAGTNGTRLLQGQAIQSRALPEGPSEPLATLL